MVCGLTVLLAQLGAQAPQPRTTPAAPGQNPPALAQENRPGRITFSVNQVVVPVTVKDGSGRLVADLPISSDVFLYIFLPLLLFETALNIEVGRVIEDAAPILLLAIVAVLVATLVIGGALDAVASVPSVACFMLG